MSPQGKVKWGWYHWMTQADNLYMRCIAHNFYYKAGSYENLSQFWQSFIIALKDSVLVLFWLKSVQFDGCKPGTSVFHCSFKWQKKNNKPSLTVTTWQSFIDTFVQYWSTTFICGQRQSSREDTAKKMCEKSKRGLVSRVWLIYQALLQSTLTLEWAVRLPVWLYMPHSATQCL